jgi:prepilin-type N-terminal cleavage/methylation domain-containing protein
MPKLTRSTPVRAHRARLAGLASRRGFTLAELMVSLVMFGLVSAIILGMVRSQQKFYRGATEVIDVRSQLRQAAALLPLELRSVSTVSTAVPAGSPYKPSKLGSDITYMSDSAVQFRATIGSGIICKKVDLAAGAVITLVPTGVLAKGNVLTSWYATPAGTDTAFVFDPGTDPGAGDDQWRPYKVTLADATKKAQCPVASGFVTSGNSPAGDDDKEQLEFTAIDALTPSSLLPTSITTGSVVRFTRSVRYSIYKAPSNEWYLGYRSLGPSASTLTAATIEPVSGPYRTYVAGGATNGLVFTYMDSTGAATTAADKVARIDIKLRGQGYDVGNTANATARMNKAKFVDSLMLSIAVRNRS